MMTIATGVCPEPFHNLSKNNKIGKLYTDSKEFFLSLLLLKLFKEKVKFTKQSH